MIPKTIDEVTTTWLAEVLDAPVRNHTLTQIGQGVGIMGDIFRVGLEYETASDADQSAHPASVVVKLPSSFEENREQGVALGMFEAEVRFYNEMAGDAAVGLPKVHRAEITPGTADFVIVMEDLTQLTMVEQIDGMTADQARAAVTVLAHVHAAWWSQVQTPELEWIPSMVSDRIAMVDQLFVQIVPTFIENFGHRLPEGGIELYQNFAGNYLNINKQIAARSPWTLAHQDFRVENMMFGNVANNEVVIIDWQGIGRGPGAYDLGYLLGGSMDTNLRRQHEADLTKTYHDTLTSLGIAAADYPYEQLWEDYRHTHLMGGLATSMITGGAMDLSNERGVELIATMASRHAAAALDHDGLKRLAELS